MKDDFHDLARIDLDVPSAVLPSWLCAPKLTIEHPPEKKAFLFSQYEMIFTRFLDSVYKGSTLENAIRELPIEIDSGAFIHWMKKNPDKYALYNEAKEVRAEVWASRIISHATGVDKNGDQTLEDVTRSKLIVDTYWKLMGADSRKTYGDTKTIEMSSTISITAALQQAQSRITLDATFEEIDEPRLLTDGNDD